MGYLHISQARSTEREKKEFMGEKDYRWTSTPQSGRSVSIQRNNNNTYYNVVVVVGRRVVFVADDDDDDVSSSPAQVRRVFFSLSIFALWESSSPNCLNYVSLSRVCIFDDYLYSFFRVGPRDARSPRRAPPRKTRTRRHPPKRHRRWYRPTPRPSR